MDTAITLTCKDCNQAVLMLGPDADRRAYYWYVTTTGKATCPPCLAKSGRVMGAPRARSRIRGSAPARAPSFSDIHTLSKTGSSSSTGYTQESMLKDRHTLNVSGGNVGGVGGIQSNRQGGLSRRRDRVPDDPMPPAELEEFDTILRRHADYRPTERFYATVLSQYGDAGLSLTWEADGMIDWLIRHEDVPGKQRRDIVRFAVRWLARAAGDPDSRRKGPAHRNGSGHGVAKQYKMGASSIPDDERASIADMDRRGGSHYE